VKHASSSFISFGCTSGRVNIICVSCLRRVHKDLYSIYPIMRARSYFHAVNSAYTHFIKFSRSLSARSRTLITITARPRKVYGCLFYSIYIRNYCTLFHFYVVLSRSSIARSFNAYYRSFYFYHGYLFSDLSHPFALSITYYFISAKSVPFFAIRSSSIIYFRFISIVIFHSGDLF